MDLHQIPLAQRLTIALFGLRNTGKSSLLNALTQQELALVSEHKGTTTDPVHKAMELFPLGPVNIIDTPGYDDEGPLGLARVEKTKQVIPKADFALLVVDGTQDDFTAYEEELIQLFQQRNLPFYLVINKIDLGCKLPTLPKVPTFKVSCLTKAGINQLQTALGKLKNQQDDKFIVNDLLPPKSTVVLVIPIDSSAPKGRIILPQQQVLRELLDHDHYILISQAHNLTECLSKLTTPPNLVITDSQAFKTVDEQLPANIPLTSFSILMARYKGDLLQQLAGLDVIPKLKPGDHILMAEGCTHHRQCEDIGTVKIPNWLNELVGGELNYHFYSGGDFPADCTSYKLMVHCGGCMLTPQQIKSRFQLAQGKNLPFTNYGMLIAYLHKILPRALAPLKF